MIRPKSALVGALALTAMASAVAAQGVPLGTPIPRKPLGQTLEEDRGAMAFAANQLTFARVARARGATDARLRALFEQRGVPYPASEIFLRVFKHERLLELWARPAPDAAFVLVKTYPVCALPGQLGPKRRMGDVQVPEGFYFIDQFNPESAFHLSLRVSYPNLADRMRREALALGGDIFIHGGCETVGCVPIENHNIEEVYWLAVQAMDAGQKLIPVHIFPTRLDPRRLKWLEENFDPEPALLTFWKNLADGYAFFEDTHQVPWVTVAQDGRYAVPAHERLAGPAPAAAPGATDDDPAAANRVAAERAAAERSGSGRAAVADSAANPAPATADATAPNAAAGLAGVTAGPAAGLSASRVASPADDTATADTADADTAAVDTAAVDTAADILDLETLPRGIIGGSGDTTADSAAAEPDSAAAEPDSAAAEPDSAAVKPDSAAAVPDSAAMKPDSAAVRPDSAAAEPDSAAVKPDSAAVKPDTAAVPDSAAGPSLPGRPLPPADTAGGKSGGTPGGAPGTVKPRPKAKPGGGGSSGR